MNTFQNQIHHTLSLPDNIELIRQLIKYKQYSNRTILALDLCLDFNFHDIKGKKQVSGCLKSLRILEKRGHFVLPRVTREVRRKTPIRMTQSVIEPTNVPDNINQIKNLKLVLVGLDNDMRVWNSLMIDEHPQQTALLVGRQLRYLICSEHGYLGGIGFASAALQLSDRDKWIGWNAEQRSKHLDLVVGMSRFLIRPSVKCPNLASKILSMSLEQMVNDFERIYGYRPLLVETFVDDARYSGTCYRAANWIKVGTTKGRGRQDRYNQVKLTNKSIYVYPIVDDFRLKMGLSSNAGRGKLTPEDGLDDDTWAEYEFGGANLGDSRLNERLVNIGKAKIQTIGRAFTGAANGDWPEVKGYYRLIDHPNESAVNPENILAPHRERTIRRMMGQKTVLTIQDGSDLNYNRLNHCKGLGVIGSNQTKKKFKGLHLHSTLAVTTTGVPLGVFQADILAPKEKASGKKQATYATPIEEKKIFPWVAHYRSLAEVADNIPNTRIINICDREADFFELFKEQQKHPSADLLVRANHDRKIKEELTEESSKLFTVARQAPILSLIQLTVQRQSSRKKRGSQKARPKRESRNAVLKVRAQCIELLPPDKIFEDKNPLKVWVVHALEENPPEGIDPIEWILITTVAINSAEDAEECLRWYSLRWRIEDWHRVLKSGCKIENLAHDSYERLCRAISINLVIAWRIMTMTLLGREQPHLPVDLLFTDIEIRTLEAFAKKKNSRLPFK